MNLPAPFVYRHGTRQVVFGWGRVSELGVLARGHGARRCVLAIDSAFRDSELQHRIVAELRVATGSMPLFYCVPAREPDIEVVDACHAVFAEADPDLIVAVGGGSTMDAAKVARMMLVNPGGAAAIAGFDVPHRPHASLFVGVPTTSGTGSEVSEMAVIGQAGSDIKLRYRSAALPFHVALLDPELTLSLPPKVTAHTGFDAFTHALEGYVSRSANLMTEPLSQNALRLLHDWLPVAVEDPSHKAARCHCMIASMQAAIAYNTSQLGLCHALAAPLGAMFHVAHGLANAIALPAVTAFNQSWFGDKAPVIAALLDAPAAAEGVARLRKRVGLEIGLDSVVPDGAGRDALASAAMRSGNMPHNPRDAQWDDVRAVVEAMR